MRVNWLAVIICTVVLFLLRYLWMAHFGGADWGHFIGRAVNNILNDRRAAGLGLADALAVSVAIGWLVGQLRDRALSTGLAAGAAAGVGFAATTAAAAHIWGGQPLRGFLIDAGYYVVAYAVAGAVCGGMEPKRKKKASG